MPSLSETEAKSRIRQIGAKVLANRFPPYAVQGGLYEALVQSQGTVLAVTNGQAVQAAEIFEASEGIDLAPAAAIAFASLLRSAKEKHIHPGSTVLLNVTGGGQHRRFFNSSSIALPADLSIASTEIESSRSLENIAMLF
jgi:cysteate synthase